MKCNYYAVFTNEKDYIDITFPDFKGCITFGKNLEDALKMSADALEGHLIALKEEKMNIPKASGYHELKINLKEGQQLKLITVDINLQK